MRGKGRKFTGAVKMEVNFGLGKSLQANRRKTINQNKDLLMRHSSEDPTISKVDHNDYAEIINRQIQKQNELNFGLVDENDQEHKVIENKVAKLPLLRIPRRPVYKKEILKQMTKQQLETAEIQSFYNWRQQLNQLELTTNLAISPYEKNINYWRQLWRVIEFSDVIFQIIDGRNPLQYYCKDLETYVQEVAKQQQKKKKSFLIINKSDFVPENVRELWKQYFISKGIDFVFFSAMNEQLYFEELERRAKQLELEKQPEEEKEQEQKQQYDQKHQKDRFAANDFSNLYKEKQQKKVERKQKKQQQKEKQQEKMDKLRQISDKPLPEYTRVETDEVFINTSRILTTQELLNVINFVSKEYQPKATVGFCGYSNIGKSSCLNCLIYSTGKRASISDSPGKTKHFQSIIVSDNLTFVDSPGLIFPCFSQSRAELVINGILPVDKESDYVSCLELICKRIPARVLNQTYLFDLKPSQQMDKFDTGRNLYFGEKDNLNNGEFYCSAKQLLDEIQRKWDGEVGLQARKVIKDYYRGKLIYLHVPPTQIKTVQKKELTEEEQIEQIPIDQQILQEIGEENQEE